VSACSWTASFWAVPTRAVLALAHCQVLQARQLQGVNNSTATQGTRLHASVSTLVVVWSELQRAAMPQLCCAIEMCQESREVFAQSGSVRCFRLWWWLLCFRLLWCCMRPLLLLFGLRRIQ
jgi:hypothetical protein